jgi:histidine triad (HIT) family protein
MSDPSCLFCKIVAGEIPADVLRETDRTLAFRDIAPKAPTHLLLIPKEHIPSVAELEREHADVLIDLMQDAQHLARAEGVDTSGWRLITNVGPDSGQVVFHVHFHLLGGRPLGPLVG